MATRVSDHYTVLGVERSAERRTIQHAYRTLARRIHPDFGGDDRDMARINEAWRILGDADRRATYDARIGRAQERVDPGPRSSTPKTRGGATVLDFGRYEGWTLVDVANVDDDYLHWLARTPAGRPLSSEIKEILQRRAEAFEMPRPASKPKSTRGRRMWGRR